MGRPKDRGWGGPIDGTVQVVRPPPLGGPEVWGGETQRVGGAQRTPLLPPLLVLCNKVQQWTEPSAWGGGARPCLTPPVPLLHPSAPVQGHKFILYKSPPPSPPSGGGSRPPNPTCGGGVGNKVVKVRGERGWTPPMGVWGGRGWSQGGSPPQCVSPPVTLLACTGNGSLGGMGGRAGGGPHHPERT